MSFNQIIDFALKHKTMFIGLGSVTFGKFLLYLTFKSINTW